MQAQDWPLTRDLVLVGGGHTHALVLRRWGMQPLPGARVTVINPAPKAPYSGMLPGHLAGHYPRAALDIDLVKLARFAGARLVMDRAVHLDTTQRSVTLASGGTIDFDVASIDIGITSDLPDLPGFADHAVPAKPLARFADAWQRALSEDGPADVAVIGGGVAGVEIVLAMAHALHTRGKSARLHLIDRGTALSAVPSGTADRLRSALNAAGVSVIENCSVEEVTPEGLRTDKGCVPAHFVCGAAGARPQGWLANTQLTLFDGFLNVDKHLETSERGIFAVGDCAHMVETPRPKAGVFAVRQAPVLFENLRHALSDSPKRRAYIPQGDYLKLISMGNKSAIGDRFGLRAHGPWVWRWKDRIDQAFMDRFRNLPQPKPPTPPRDAAAGLFDALREKPLCGGCGAKLGQPALMRALDAGNAPGDDAALISIAGRQSVFSTDHLRALVPDPAVMARIAAQHALGDIWAMGAQPDTATDHLRALVPDPAVMARIAAQHALGDIWAMGAQPETATATVILPRLSERLATRSLAEIMAAAREVMSDAGATIVGGHSAQGAELTVGFSVIGRCDRPALTLSGARPGARLVLTKPIGSGVIMAAEMAGRADGAWVAAALAQMQTSQRAAAHCLTHATAATDVTGFGLIGHLRNICQSSGVGARLWAEAVPLMPGAEALAADGVEASLFAQNRQALPDLPRAPRLDLLFDPQTAGGLLACVPPGTGTLEALRAAGFDAAEIGEITDRPGLIEVV